MIIVFNSEKFTGFVASSAPTAPSNLTAEVLTNGFISLKWKDNSNDEDGFKIERKEGENGVWETISTTSPNIWSGSSAWAPKINTLYYYRIKAYNSAGESAYTNEASAMIKVDIPNAPSNLKAEAISSGKAKLIWSDNSDNEGGFLIEYKKDSEWSALVSNLNGNSKQHMIISLTPGVTYSFRVAAINAGGTSGYSEATITMPSGNEVVEGEPFAMVDINMDRKISIADAMYIAQYVEGKRNLTSVQMLAGDINCDGIVTTEDASKIAEYEVGKLVELASCTSIITNTGGVPLAPSRVRAVADPKRISSPSASITITWQDNSNNEGGFKIKRLLGGTNVWTEIANVSAGTTTYTDTNLNYNTTYGYSVIAYNSAGNSIQGSSSYAKTILGIATSTTNQTVTNQTQDSTINETETNRETTDETTEIITNRTATINETRTSLTCSDCGKGLLKVCGETECKALGEKCLFTKGILFNSCADTVSNQTTIPATNRTAENQTEKFCSDCGKGLTNLCDKTECESIEEGCLFTRRLSNPCISYASETCKGYEDKITCEEDKGELKNCEWREDKCVGAGMRVVASPGDINIVIIKFFNRTAT